MGGQGAGVWLSVLVVVYFCLLFLPAVSLMLFEGHRPDYSIA